MLGCTIKSIKKNNKLITKRVQRSLRGGGKKFVRRFWFAYIRQTMVDQFRIWSYRKGFSNYTSELICNLCSDIQLGFPCNVEIFLSICLKVSILFQIFIGALKSLERLSQITRAWICLCLLLFV